MFAVTAKAGAGPYTLTLSGNLANPWVAGTAVKFRSAAVEMRLRRKGATLARPMSVVNLEFRGQRVTGVEYRWQPFRLGKYDPATGKDERDGQLGKCPTEGHDTLDVQGGVAWA